MEEVLLGLGRHKFLSLRWVSGLLSSLVSLLGNPGMVPSAMRELCFPGLEDLLLLLVVVEGSDAQSDLLDSLPQSFMILVIPRYDERLLGVGSTSLISGTGTSGLPDSEVDSGLPDSESLTTISFLKTT